MNNKEGVMHYLNKVQHLQRTAMGCNCMTITTHGFNNTMGVTVFWQENNESCEIFRMFDYHTEEEMKAEFARLTELIRKSGWL